MHSTEVQLTAIDLRKAFPRSPGEQMGGYNILPRTIDKCRAALQGLSGEYQYNCPLDQIFFSFTQIDPTEFQALVATGATDDSILEWVKTRTPQINQDQILAWSYDNRIRQPEDEEEKAYFEEMRLSHSPQNYYIKTWFELLDSEEQRI